MTEFDIAWTPDTTLIMADTPTMFTNRYVNTACGVKVARKT